MSGPCGCTLPIDACLTCQVPTYQPPAEIGRARCLAHGITLPCPECDVEHLKARVRELEAWKRDTEESFRVVLEDRGEHDELHCSCVPVLRARIRELEAELSEEQDETARLNADRRACLDCEHASVTDEERLKELEGEIERLNARVLSLILERDRYQASAEQRWALRREIEAELGVGDTYGDGQKEIGLERIKGLKAENSRLRAALEAVEWFDAEGNGEYGDCPWCHAYYSRGHYPDCQRQLALRGEG